MQHLEDVGSAELVREAEAKDVEAAQRLFAFDGEQREVLGLSEQREKRGGQTGAHG